MNIYKNKQSAFSLIELSVVILIIALLTTAVIKFSYILTKSRLRAAESLTSGSVVSTIPDLFAWWEPAMETSFNKQNQKSDTVLENSNGGSWFDRSINKNNATTVTGSPQYKEKAINNIIAIRFSGTNNNGIQFDASGIVYKDFTVFVVDQRLTNSSSPQVHISWGGGVELGYTNQTNISITPTTTPSSSVTIAAYTTPQPRIITYMISRSSLPFKQGVFINGGSGSIAASTSITQSSTLTNMIGYIGRNSDGSSLFTGDIAEIIIYSRALNIWERNEVQKYLSKKYSITITQTTD